MSRNRLIKKLKEKNPKLNKPELEIVLDTFSKSIGSALKDNLNVEIRGLGRWSHKKLKENYYARNPATNKLIYKPERVKIKFKASKKLSRNINNKI